MEPWLTPLFARLGLSFEEFVTEEIFKPLRMTETVWFPEEAITRPVAAGHSPSGSVEDGWVLPRVSFPAGQITSSSSDMLLYGRFMLGDGVPLVSSEAFHSLLTPTISVGGAQGGSHSCGLSWFLRGEEGEGSGLRICHGGATNGQLSGFALHRGPTGLVVNIMTNGAQGRALATEVEDWIVERLVGEVPKPPPLPLPLEFSLAQYQGVYANSRSLSRITVTADEEQGTLTLSVAPNAPVQDWHTADAEAEEPPPGPPPTVVRMIGKDACELGVMFVRGDDGEVEWLRNMRLLRKQPSARL